MSEINVSQAIERLGARTLKEQAEGLADLKHILNHNRRNSRVENIKDASFHAIYETLFGLATKERSNYLLASGARAKVLPGKRLEEIASVLRIAVELGVTKIKVGGKKVKTVEALIEHIIQLLPVADEGFCSPLCNDYPRILRAVLQYQPHVEHLPKDLWNSIAQFCLEYVTPQDDDDDEVVPDSFPPNGNSAVRSIHTSFSATSRSATRELRSRSKQKLPNAVVDDLVRCLRLLVAAPNAPLADKAYPVVSGLIAYLGTTGAASRAQQDAFAAVSSVLSQTWLDSALITRQLASELFPPIMHNWNIKNAPREEMLVCLVYVLPHIASALLDPGTESIKSDVENLTELLFNEYSRRQEKDQLQVDDLMLVLQQNKDPRRTDLRAPVFGLRSINVRLESCWMISYLVASLSVHMQRCKKLQNGASTRDDEAPSKKQRISSGLLDYLRLARSPSHSVRGAALQVVAFIVQQTRMEVAELADLLDRLVPLLSEDDGVGSSWAMLIAAGCCVQPCASAPELTESWRSLWEMALRSVSSAYTCRAACHFTDLALRLGLVKYSAVSDHIEALSRSVTLHGPAVMTDSAVSLWETIAALVAAESPGLFSQSIDAAMQWLLRQWNPSKLNDRNQLIHMSQNHDPGSIQRMLCLILDLDVPPKQASFLTLGGAIAQSWRYSHEYQNLAQYLLFPSDNIHMLEQPISKLWKASSSIVGTSRTTVATEVQILEHCIAELGRVRRLWKELHDERTQSLTSDVVQVAYSLCIVTAFVADGAGLSDNRRLSLLRAALDETLELVGSYLSSSSCEQAKVDSLLATISSFLPDLSEVDSSASLHHRFFWFKRIADSLSTNLSTRREIQEHSNNGYDDDLMEVDSDFESQRSQNKAEDPSTDYPRTDLAANMSVVTLRASVRAFLAMVSSFSQGTPSGDNTEASVTTSFIEYLVSLPSGELLACRPLMAQLLSLNLELSQSSAGDLVEAVGQHFLQSYQYERCEVAMGMCLDILNGLTSLLVDTTMEELYDLALDLFAWFTKAVLGAGTTTGAGVSSPNVQIGFTKLLHNLLKVNSEYGQELSLPSVRTSLFLTLQQGPLVVKYHIAEHISDMFGLFVLSTHDAIFDDVYNSLPKDSDWLEGLAVRLLILSRLASAWHTLLRRSVYHIFETAGLVEDATLHAKRCIGEITASLRLASPTCLFKLFAPQLIYTWSESNPLSQLPYSIFGYENLPLLLMDVKAEAFGQLMMRGKIEEARELASILQSTLETIVTDVFGKVAAYSIAWDICPSSSQTVSAGGGNSEAGVRNLLGKEAHFELIVHRFPQIIGVLFMSTELDEQIEKAFQKRPAFDPASKAFREMKAISSSTALVFVEQQPTFKAKYLLDIIERVCRRTNMDPDRFWTPSTTVIVARMLIDRIDPSLGPLHASSTIRKLRIMIAMSGDAALTGYAPEMLLHALRPYITEAQCADDTLGVVQYIFTHAKPYLLQQPSFTAGNCLMIFVSLRVFLSSSQDSTTQESQHRATLSKAQAFHSWLGAYLDDYKPDKLDEASRDAFRHIIQAARNIRSEGNAFVDTAEGTLLKALFDDERSGRKLLSRPALRLAFSLLSSGFQVPSSSKDDLLGTNEKSISYSADVWRSCQFPETTNEYTSWAGRVLGRMYCSTGSIEPLQPRNGSAERITHVDDEEGNDTSFSDSRTAIIRTICDLLLSDDNSEVSYAERTLRLVYGSLETLEDAQSFEQIVPHSLIAAISPEGLPSLDLPPTQHIESLRESLLPNARCTLQEWVKNLALALVMSSSKDAVLGALSSILSGVKGLPERIFSYLLHEVLLKEHEGHQKARQVVSEAYQSWFATFDETSAPHVRILLDSILYLRTQPLPRETTKSDRDRWLELDFAQVSRAAQKCGHSAAALLFAEIYASQAIRGNRRSSVLQPTLPDDLLLEIYGNVPDPDSFYGLQQAPSLETVLSQTEFEGDGYKSLLLRGARIDSQARRLHEINPVDSAGTVKALTLLNLNAVTQSVLADHNMHGTSKDMVGSRLRAARHLEKWDVRAPEAGLDEDGHIFRTLQVLQQAPDRAKLRDLVNQGLTSVVRTLRQSNSNERLLRSGMRTLAVLTEIDELGSTQDLSQLREVWNNMKNREGWMQLGRFEDAKQILSSRELALSAISNQPHLQELMHVNARDSRTIHFESLLELSSIARKHEGLQESLSAVTYMNDLLPQCKDLGLHLDVPVSYEVANVLWDQGEKTISIRLLRELSKGHDWNKQSISVGKAGLLAKLGHQISEARLEKPDAILQNYLAPAVRELKLNVKGDEAGKVYHEFALFCDKQLQNPDSLEDYKRITKLRDRQKDELDELDQMLKESGSSTEKRTLSINRDRARLRFEMDDAEFQRLHNERESFLCGCLENYLLTLQASDEFNDDVLRFFALWLDNAEVDVANDSVRKHLRQVPSRKFAQLMTQMTSRLQDFETEFQLLLNALVLRICVDHPFHGMDHIYTSARSSAGKDEAAISRNAAAKKIGERLKSDLKVRRTWVNTHNSNVMYHDLARFRDDKYKPGLKLELKKVPMAARVMQQIPELKVPPPTMTIPLRDSCDYSDVPRIVKFKSTLTIAGGLSQPKIVTAITSDGEQYKQLFKGGNDDLRQDAIMEQVFGQVSELLKNHRETRQRKLQIRTYKVVPLSERTGIMEFVQNTLPLHDFIMPAHQLYHPKDMKYMAARKIVENAQGHGTEYRIKAYRQVTDKFQPVLKYFFLERFTDPDEWFERRLAYTRSTAAISILGHILGLGDRHTHNILLDEKTGEAVHIDLGVAFEAGRVLPVPEVVPFRLTRDIVDGMGITKTEGVFRRCCEFTMDALREDIDSIMTLLNVLRYDPLYSWTLSPLKAKRMQEAEAQEGGEGGVTGETAGDEASKRSDDETGEAERALSVVQKKLSKTLSTAATVNELIQQATDERNLALLFAGWAAFA